MIPDSLLNRIEYALARHAAGLPARNVPWRATDSDAVLAELRSWRRGEPQRFALGPVPVVAEVVR